MRETFSIAVIGAGFSGALLAVHLLRKAPPHVRVYLIERNESFGRGLAYATDNPGHLLNVPAGRMSAFANRPDHFLSWLRGHAAALGLEEQALSEGAFMPRGLFGRYVQHLLSDGMTEQRGNRNLYLVPDEAVALSEEGEGLTVMLESGRPIRADIAVLAVGNFPPEAPPIADPAFYRSPRYHGDPWRRGTLDTIEPAAPVLLIGTGLTMVDTAIALWERGHTGRIHALSRRGLLPRRHAPADPLPSWAPDDLPVTALALLRRLRGDIRAAQARGQDWRGVIDSLRPVTAPIWQKLPPGEQRKFLRFLRPWWDVHRHRLAPAVADRLDRAVADGKLVIHAGQIRALTEGRKRVGVDYRPRRTIDDMGGDGLRSLEVRHVVNCSGPCCDYGRIRRPLVRSLLDQGIARPDALRLGLDVTADLRLIAAGGQASERLYAIGPVTRGRFWEITAVPDIRRHCESLAAALIERLAPD